MIRLLLEQAVQIQKDLYLCFIDYIELFDSIGHEELLQILEKLYSLWKYIVVIRCIYWEQAVFHADRENAQCIRKK